MASITSIIDACGYPPLLYTDEDKLEDGHFVEPYFKPDWDPVLFGDSCYIAHLCAIDRLLALRLGAYTDEGAEGSHDWDTFMRFWQAGSVPRHVPEVMYSWRKHMSSTAQNMQSKPFVYESQKTVLRKLIAAQAEPDRFEVLPSPLFNATPDWRIARTQQALPRVLSIELNGDPDVVPQILDSLLRAQLPHGLVHLHRRGVQIQDSDWIAESTGLMELFPDTAIVGGTIHDGSSVISGPLTFGFGRGFDCADAGRPLDHPGYSAQMWKHRTVSAVSVAHCVLSHEYLSSIAGALAGQQLSAASLGAWLGGMARRHGKRAVFSPFLRALAESALEDAATAYEIAAFRAEFADLIPDDQYYSKHFGLTRQTAYRPVKPAARKQQLQSQLSTVPHYQEWLAQELRIRKRRFPMPAFPARFCVLTPVYEGTDAPLFQQLEATLKAQSLPVHRWVVAVDGPVGGALEKRLERLAHDPAVRVVKYPHNRGITQALKLALEHAEGDYVIPIDADDLITEDALQIMAHEVERTGHPEFLYSDEDMLVDGRPAAPYLRPDFDPILATESSYVWHLAATRRDVAMQLNLYSDDGATWCHDWDTLLRVAYAGLRIVHVREILYHWRRHSGSVSNREQVNERSLSSVRHILERRIGLTARPDLFEVADVPLDRGTRELYIQRRRVAAPRSIVVAYGDKPCGLSALREALTSEVRIVLFAHESLEIEKSEVFWEATRLFDLHPELAAVGGTTIDGRGAVCDSCWIWDSRGRFVPNVLDAMAQDASPWALLLKAHQIVRPSVLVVVYRASIVKDALGHASGTDPLSAFVADLADRIASLSLMCAYSPLVRGRVRGQMNAVRQVRQPEGAAAQASLYGTAAYRKAGHQFRW